MMKKKEDNNYQKCTYLTYSNYHLELSEKDKRAIQAFVILLKRRLVHLIETKYPNMA